MTSSSVKITLVAALALGVALPPLASGEGGGGGGGGQTGVAGIVHIRNKPPYFHGNIGAENEICSSPRTIKLFKRKGNGDRKLLGTTVSDIEDEGVKASWEVPIDAKPGTYFATSPKAHMDNGGYPVDCQRAKSRTVTLD